MGVKAYLTEKLFGAAIEKAVQERLPAAGAAAGDDIQWRRLTGNSVRELPIATWQRQVEVCYWLWKLNPMGNWIIEIITYLAAGQGFTYSAENEEVQELLEDFWYDPVNRIDINLEQMARELFLFGVQCWPVFRAEQTGHVRLGMIDPAQIANIYTDPENAKIQIGVQVQDLQNGGNRYLRTVLTGETETVVSEAARRKRETFTDGECFLFAINRVSNDPFGTSDLFVIADWLDEFEDFVFKFAAKAKKQNAFIWDVTMDGATETQCQEFANANANPPDGATRVHNEKVKWQAVSPSLQSLEIKEAASVFRNHILSSKSIPVHWYGGLDDVNRASAAEGNEPIKAFLNSRQNLLKFILETVFTYVIQSALDASYLKVSGEEAFDFAVQKPESMDKDITKLSTAIRDIVTALVAAASQGWVLEADAAKVFAFVLALIGYELDPEAAVEGAEWQDYEEGSKPGKKQPAKNIDEYQERRRQKKLAQKERSSGDGQ
jgi:hypothetical protein